MEQTDSYLIPGLLARRGPGGRSSYSEQGKRSLVAIALRPGVSVAKLAQINGVNANLVRRWIREFCPTLPSSPMPPPSTATTTLLPVVRTPEPHPEKMPVPVSDSSAVPAIEIVFEKASIRLHGNIDARQLRLVIDCLART